ncbi:MAG: putative beta-lysine N-acetyltransferase [Desulfobulbaceae bacterium]|nr:putative beta-lysine N-acetyltransferase [Desulfobulbaceae bacterium]HIJ90136.1 putative beta-lysine N-acetyltransferase [Deltaproteobacteria bacterium]
MKPDAIEQIGDSLIQHGKVNNRAYVMKIGKMDCARIVDFVVSLALTKGYTKIFAKVPTFARSRFMDNGFVEEARIPDLFQGKSDSFFLSRFFSAERELEKQPELVSQVLEIAEQKAGAMEEVTLPSGLVCQTMERHEVEEMAQLYRQVFASYPFPIHDPEYLAQTMDENLIYFGIRADDKLIALSSAEIDFSGQNAEMTDFATLPEARGLGLATYLLAMMEDGIRHIGIKTAFTIARAYSFGMNITFAKHDYIYAGPLVNNTQISGTLQSMNVWHKRL